MSGVTSADYCYQEPWWPGTPLRPFAGRVLNAPYTFQPDPHTKPGAACPQGSAFRVFPLRLKTGYSAGNKGRGPVHDTVCAAAYVDGQNVMHIGARWLCGGAGTQVVLLPPHRGDGARCGRCAATRSDENAAPGVYRFADAQGTALYIGSSGRPGDRILSHARSRQSADWWPLVADVQITHYETVEAALAAEARAQLTERPRFNKQAVIPLHADVADDFADIVKNEAA